MVRVNNRLGMKLFPSQGQMISDLTVLNNGTYWIQGPVKDEIEEALKEEIEMSPAAVRLYKEMCTVDVSFSPVGDTFYFRFHEYPSRPWFTRKSHDYHHWLAMVDGYESSRTTYFTEHKFMAITAMEWLDERGYTIINRCKDVLYPQNHEQMEVEFGDISVTLRDHQEESVKIAEERDYKVVIGDQPGLGKCLKGDTLIMLGDGTLKEIREIYDDHKSEMTDVDIPEEFIDLHGVKVISFDGKKMITADASQLYRQKINAPLITIKTASGKKITSTLSHKFYVFDHNGYGVWKKSSDLTMNDYIAIPSYLPLDNSARISPDFSNNFVETVNNKIRIKRNDSIHNNNQVPIKCPNIFTSEFFEFMGWMLAEGCEGEYGSCQRVALHQHNEDILDRFGELFRINFGIEPNVDKDNHNVHINSISVAEYLKSIGYEFGYKARNKRFPNWIVSAPLELMNVCLRSFFDGDGSMMKNGVLEVSSASRILIHQIYYMLLRNGIVATYSEAQKGLRLGLTNLHYTLRIMSVGDLRSFRDKIGFSLERKQSRLEDYIETTNAGQRYHYGIPFNPDLMRHIRDVLGLQQDQLGVTLGTIMHLESTLPRNIGRDHLIKIIERSIKRCEDFSNWFVQIPKLRDWGDIIRCINALNIKKTKIGRILDTSPNNINYRIRKNKIDHLFFDVREVLIRLCQEAMDLRETLENILYNISVFRFDNITSIEVSNNGEQCVYDLYVPETNNFVAGNGVLCHNTISAGAILHALNKQGIVNRILWVVPNSALTEQVRGEMIDKFDTDVFTLTGETVSRAERLGVMKNEHGHEVQVQSTEYERHGFVCTNWSLFSKDFTKGHEFVKNVTFDAIVLDEAHRCKEGNVAYDAALALTSPVRIALSGTVMPNGKWEELFDMLNVIDPPAAPSKEYFKKMYYNYMHKLKGVMDERDAEAEAERRVSKVALKYMISKISFHSKDDVLDDLPKVIESRINVPFSKVDKQVFDYYKEIMFGTIDALKEYPSHWEMSDRLKKKYYSTKAMMVMIYQDLRRFCAFGSSVLKNRVKEYLHNQKYTYKILRDLFRTTIKELERLSRTASESPKNRKIIHFIQNNDAVKKCVIFCTEIEPNKKMVFDLAAKGVPAKIIMGKSNKLTDAEAEKLDQPYRFRDQDVEDILDWFWMPWSRISSFLVMERGKGNLDSVKVGERTIKNFFYTSLAIALPKEEGSHFTITMQDASDAEDFIQSINNDGFYRAEIEDDVITCMFNRETTKILVTTDKLQEGINLQDANAMIFYDYPFSIREREQRMSRVWRDGSRHDQISVIYVMNGIEYRLEKKLKEKYNSTSVLGFADPSPISMKEFFSII